MYAYPSNIAFNANNNDMITFIHNKPYKINIDDTFTSKSNIVFYLYYETNDDNSIDISMISNIDIRWILPTNPLYFNSYNFSSNYLLIKDKKYNECKLTHYFNTMFYNKFQEVILNNSNYNNMIWTSKHRPLLSEYLNRMNKYIMYK